MDTSDWVSVQREDGETVGYLQPLDPAYEQVIARNVLGHAIQRGIDYRSGEELLIERGISELMNAWIITAGDQAGDEEFSILEVTPQEIILGNALRTKALAPTPRISIPWPDTAPVLARAGR
ncbi:hypothetical protein AUR04nite_25600 [Glutamicibacter uratoxydans]|uniref:Uncharacterized protein n=1 Tax=Glutamicibacter uratoxydans TaxID=43667 RepID=A0A4Y4DUJ6_GLUUR|nr:hypothetical protein [Glutamicibacter uratoxydans]GED07028.1 hypothetical protein AUR04nite_25600 [Glutamicibacter uratoxydans]